MGGDTLFANQHLALAKMSEEMKARFADKIAIHSAVLGYSKEGTYGDPDKNGAMDVRISDAAYEQHTHPLVRPHPETGEMGIFGTGFSYIIGFEGLTNEEATPLIEEIYNWQAREEFLYRHKWEKNMLVMWDNRSVLHCATGGFEGHRRELHRITVYE